jgi:HK97 family phage major capsid protein
MMPHALVEGYIAERDQLLNTCNVLKNTALDRGGDPTDADIEVMEKAYQRIDKLDALIKVVGEDKTMDAEARDKLLAFTPSAPTAGPHYRSGGEMVWDCLHASYGSAHDHEDQEAKRRWETVMKRAAQHMGTAAADTTPVAGGFGELFVAPIVGPVINLTPTGQPFLSAMGKRPAPNSMTFSRPRVVDPNFKTGAAEQTLEKAELTSVKFDVKVDNLSLTTVGGYLNVSQQLMSLHPTAWDIIVGQLQRRTAYQGEAAAIDELNNTTAHIPLAAGANSATTFKALFDAAALVYENTQELPTWIAYGPKGWAQLGSLTDAAGRPLFPFLGAANAMGTSSLGDFALGPLGLGQIVTPGITTTDIYVGNSLAFEAYTYPFPLLEAVEPSLLGRQVAVAEAMAFYRPTTKEADPAAIPPTVAEQNGAVRVGP